MGRDKEGLRHRAQQGAGQSDIQDTEVVKEKMGGWISRLFYPYRLLLLFSLVVCLIQILIGISFFNSFSSQYNAARKPASPPQNPQSPPIVADPLAVPLHSSLSKLDPALKFPCNVSSKEAVSAITRATTRECRQELVDLVCKLEEGKVYAESLPRSCPTQVEESEQGEHLGCYQDSFSTRLLQGHTLKLKETNSADACLDVCTEYGFSLAGLQYGVECFCGNTKPPASKELGEDKCDMPCPGEEGESCGGYLTMDVFHTGLKPLVPSKLGRGPWPITGNEENVDGQPPVKIVYLLTIAGRASRQVSRLIKRIYSPDHYILVHVDSRQEYMHREVSKLAAILPNLRLVSKRYSTIWGGASLLTMLLSALNELLAMPDWTDWDFVLNLSESDFPVKTQAELVSFLSSNRGSNFVKSHGREQDKFIKKQGLDRTFHECDTHMWRLGNRELPLGLQIDGGSDWICLNRDFASYVVNSEEELVTGLKTLFSYTLLPAESFFHTVLRNSEYCQTYIDNNLHLTNWKRKQGCKCQYKAIVDWCGCSPNDFLADDWTKLEGTKARQLFFARKFEAIIHQGVVNKVEDWVEGEGTVPQTSKSSYWQNIFHHEDVKPSMNIDVLDAMLAMEVSTMSQCKVSSHSLLEVTALAVDNIRDSNLLLFEAKDHSSSQLVQLELQMRYEQKLHIANSHSSRFTGLTVGTDFDPKELIFRNYLGLISQESKIAARITFSEGEKDDKEVYTIGWLDPSGRLVGKNKLQVNDTAGIDSVSPSLLPPLPLGHWTVLVVLAQPHAEASLIAKEKFLVVPSSSQVQEVKPLPTIQDASLEQFITVEDRTQPAVTSFDESISALHKFFSFPSVCKVTTETSSDSTSLCSSLPSCKDATWSSRYPDPKSSILGVGEDGRLLS